MSGSEASAPLQDTFALLERYVRGAAPLADVVAAFRALPPGSAGDAAFAVDAGDEDAPAWRERLEALWRALSESERAG